MRQFRATKESIPKNNTFFDIHIRQEDSTNEIRAMANSSSLLNFVMVKCNSKTPVQLSGINDASGTLFFNSNTGSRNT